MLHLFLKGIRFTSRYNVSFMPRLSRLDLQSLPHVTWFIQQWRCLLFVWIGNFSPAAFMPLQPLPSPLHTDNCLAALHKEHNGHRPGSEKNLCSTGQYIFNLDLFSQWDKTEISMGRKKIKSTSRSKSWSLFSYLEKKGFYFTLVCI